MTVVSDDVQLLAWENDIPLLTSRYILLETGKWIVLTYIVSVRWIAYLFAALDQTKEIPFLASIFAAVCGAILNVALLVMLVFYGNCIRMRYVMDARGVGSTLLTCGDGQLLPLPLRRAR